MQTRLSAFERADRYLRDLVASSPEGHFVLPSLTRLSAECGVSRMTMYKAVARLKAAGVLVSSPGRGIIAAAAVPAKAAAPAAASAQPEPAPAPSLPWESVKLAISAHLLDGTYARGAELPSRKEMLRRYGVCPATLRRALRALEREGRLETCRRGYRVPEPSFDVPGAATLLHVSFTEDTARLPLLTPFTRDMLRALERGCQRHAVRLRVTSFDTLLASREQAGRSRGSGPLEGTVLGAVVSTIAPFRERFLEALDTLCARGMPLALIEEGGNRGDTEAAAARPLCKAWALATGTDAGRRMARYLLNLGHTRIAYLSHLAESDQTSPRLAGLRHAWRSAGLDTAAISVWHAESSAEAMGDSPEFKLLDDGVARAAERYATAMSGVRVRPDVSLFVWGFGAEHWGARKARDMFRTALDSGAATAWVCANDTLALLALDYLHAQGIAVPQEISVVGFDDTIEAFERGLTSYNFAPELVVQAALDHVFAPRRRRGEPLVSEIPGTVMARASSGPAPGRSNRAQPPIPGESAARNAGARACG